MRCKKQPLGAKIEIKNVWEVRMDLLLWDKVIRTAKLRKKTYSWIVRYCVFELARKKSLRWTEKLQQIDKEIKSKKSENQHRHMLCLYGDDEFLLRNSALILGITVSQLIRIALELFLNRVLNGKTSDKNLFWRGIKLFAQIKIFRSLKKNNIAMVFHSYIIVEKKQYWGFT
ncbi:MAG: hypothetical protein OEZ22_02325 [Spirochaetia bacterium]|nr:hypothetical protein [Spirochaetia bacterium]